MEKNNIEGTSNFLHSGSMMERNFRRLVIYQNSYYGVDFGEYDRHIPHVHGFLTTNTTAIIKLERLQPRLTDLKEIRWRDHSRLTRTRHPFKFNLTGSLDLGYYYTKLKIGSPPREYRLVIDTGSEISWISCTGCHNCPTSNTSGMQFHLYNPNKSSSAVVVSCSECPLTPHCNPLNQQCIYRIQYMDKSGTEGYLVSDIFHLDTVSTSVFFGCSTNQSGTLISDNSDGILGWDPRRVSLISQLSTPSFSHCLSGGEAGGGVIVLGEIVDPRIVYSRLDLSWEKYNLNLQSISLNGKVVQIDPAIFESKKGGTSIDMGTTLIVLALDAYDPVIDFLTTLASTFAQPVTIEGYQCFKVSRRLHDKFPSVSFNFEGGVSMIIQPNKYLIW